MKKMVIILMLILINTSLWAPPMSEIDKEVLDRFSKERFKDMICLLLDGDHKFIYKQAVLESDFNSNLFVNYNNLFGMHFPRVRETTANGYVWADTGRKYKVSTYASWQDCVMDMKLFQDYYKKHGYSMDPYRDFIKRVYNNNPGYVKAVDRINYGEGAELCSCEARVGGGEPSEVLCEVGMGV